ncbi:MAG: rhodanese-like domain-containing protein [Smithellaceae bacterium]|nr:rhodanese-like domain-containing protein [Smithellaceae bacterium]
MKKILLVMCAVMFLAMPLGASARDIAPIVSADWLEKNLTNPRLVVVDIRTPAEYKEGHIPGAINVAYGTWAITKKELNNELPDDADLEEIISSAGLKTDSLVVVSGKVDTATDQVNMNRVLKTLKYAGLNNIAVLDGAYNQWVKEKRATTPEITRAKASGFKANWNRTVFANKDEFAAKLGKAVIIDARGADVFYGVAKIPLVAKFGHAPSAVNLPSAWIYTPELLHRGKDELAAIAAGVVGKDLTREIIVYCDTGRLNSGWFYILREVLGYANVKSYDGSMQEWTKDPAAPMVRYSWH